MTATKKFGKGTTFRIGDKGELRIEVNGKQVHIFAPSYWHYINDEGPNV